MTHPHDDAFWRDDPTRPATEQHAATCDPCAQRLQDLRSFEQALADRVTWEICDTELAELRARQGGPPADN